MNIKLVPFNYNPDFGRGREFYGFYLFNATINLQPPMVPFIISRVSDRDVALREGYLLKVPGRQC